MLVAHQQSAEGYSICGAGATSYTAIALFKALLIEARNPPSASYETILTNVLTRQDATGSPRVEILEEDLRAGGVPVGRATELAARLNTCIRFGVERFWARNCPGVYGPVAFESWCAMPLALQCLLHGWEA